MKISCLLFPRVRTWYIYFLGAILAVLGMLVFISKSQVFVNKENRPVYEDSG